MNNWKTTMTLSYNDRCIITDQIKIKRGIFQGDSFSPLLFCLALVPLTSELATSGYGYKIKNASAPIRNLFLYGLSQILQQERTRTSRRTENS